MNKLIFRMAFGAIFLVCTPFIVVGNSLIVKLSSTGCYSCFLSLTSLKNLKPSINLKIILNESNNPDFLEEKISKLIVRNCHIVKSDSLFKQYTYNSSSYYLQDHNGNTLIKGLLNELDISAINFKSISLLNLDTTIISKQHQPGRKYINMTESGNIVSLNMTNNSLSILNHKTKKLDDLYANQIGREIIYKAMHKGDTNGFYSRVTKHTSSLKNYGMFDLRFEVVTVHSDSCFVLANIVEVEEVFLEGEVNQVFTPQIIAILLSCNNIYKPILRPIDDLPKKYRGRYSFDNTQKSYIKGNSEVILLAIWKDDLRGKNRIFAKYQLRNGRYSFIEFGKHQLPLSFKKDKLVYEFNQYEILYNLLLFKNTSEYINLLDNKSGDLKLGKSLIEKVEGEYNVSYSWILEGYCVTDNNKVFITFLDNGLRKIAILNKLSMKLEILLSSSLLDTFEISSNILVDENGNLLFFTKESNLVCI